MKPETTEAVKDRKVLEARPTLNKSHYEVGEKSIRIYVHEIYPGDFSGKRK